jgi:type II secretory pathway component GspD/PulD (secretin)
MGDALSIIRRVLIAMLCAFVAALPVLGGAVRVCAAESADAMTSVAAAPSTDDSNSAITDGVSSDGKKKISLDLKGIDLEALFRLFSLKTNQTIVLSKNVSGRATIFLNSVTAEDALDVILMSQGLAAEKRGNILVVMNADEYKARFGRDFAEQRVIKKYKLQYAKPASVFAVLSQMKSDVGRIVVDETTGMLILIDTEEKLTLMDSVISDMEKPLDTQIFDLKFGDAENIKTQLQSVLTQGTGSALIDKSTGTVVVSDLPERMKMMRVIMDRLDKEPAQVYIEAEVWQVTLRNEFQKGIDWSTAMSALNIVPQNVNIQATGALPVTNSFQPSPGLSSTAAGSLQIGNADKNDHQILIKMLETYGDVSIISRPKISVINNQEAKILVGEERPYVSSTTSQGSSGATVTSETPEFKEVGIKLNVTPSITPEGTIVMLLRQEISSITGTVKTPNGNEIPIVEKSEAETRVKIADGRMLVIGGLIKKEKSNTRVGIPVLKDLPVVKHVFGSDSKQDKSTELVLFLRPRVITAGESMTYDTIRKSNAYFDEMHDMSSDAVGYALPGNRKSPSVVTESAGEETSSADPASASVREKLKGYKGL